jgi:uncharacterized protein (DUF427 family)
VATYWHARMGGSTIDDVAWSYEEPLDESRAIRGLISFDEIVVSVRTDLPEPAQL